MGGKIISIISPSGPVKPKYVHGAVKVLRERGFEVKIMPHALGEPDGIYASTVENRVEDFKNAWEDPETDIILCSRGGYGAIQLVPALTQVVRQEKQTSPKRLVGFSDISILHALLNSKGIPSVHGPMTKDIASPNRSVDILLKILQDNYKPKYTLPTSPLNIEGEAEGIVCGGNLATFSGLDGTPLDPLGDASFVDKILFFEDVGEPIYKINRMLWQMYLQGRLQRAAGIIVGQFTEINLKSYREGMQEMNAMIAETFAKMRLKCPVIFDFPAGHIDNNLPLLFGVRAKISVGAEKSVVQF